MIPLRENMLFKGLQFYTLPKKDSSYTDIEQLSCFLLLLLIESLFLTCIIDDQQTGKRSLGGLFQRKEIHTGWKLPTMSVIRYHTHYLLENGGGKRNTKYQ